MPGIAPGSASSATHDASRPDPTHAFRDGTRWPLGRARDVDWIVTGTTRDDTMSGAIPAVFEAYTAILLPDEVHDQQRHDQALLSVLRDHSAGLPWWLGYLDTGADDVVFEEAARLMLYSNWPYVFVQAGVDQAATWRNWERGRAFWSGQLPNLMFPIDRAWLVTTLWDDDWTCVGGPAELVDSLLHHPELQSRARPAAPADPRAPLR